LEFARIGAAGGTLLRESIRRNKNHQQRKDSAQLETPANALGRTLNWRAAKRFQTFLQGGVGAASETSI
jgi:hypothetical protein